MNRFGLAQFIKGSFRSVLQPTALTADRSITIPDASGVLALTALAQAFTAQQSCTPASVALSANAVTLDMSSRNAFTTSLNANLNTVTLSNVAAGQSFVWLLTNTGTFTATFPASFVFLLPSGVTSAVASGAGKRTLVSGFCFDGTNFVCTIAKEA